MTQQQSSQIPAVPADLQSLGSTLASSAGQLNAAGTSMSTQVQTARVSGLKRAAAAAAALYGADSAEAVAAKQAVTSAQAKTGQLQIVSHKASTPAPTVASSGWALHGRVYDANLNPQERYTVFLVDAQKNYLSDYGFSYTDATGYFLIQYQGASASGSSAAAAKPGTGASSAGSLEQDEASIDLNLLTESDAASKSSPESGAPTAKSDSPPASPQAFLQVCDAKANPVFSSSTAFTPVAGQARYQVITLPAAGQPLGDPPAGIRAVAMPPIASTTKKTAKPSSDSGAS